MKPKILWTVLPKGVSADGTKLGLSLLVSPRCETGSADPVSLGEFPAMVSWPQHQLQITLRFGNQSPVAATIVPPAPDLALWQALFPENGTSVNSYEEPAFLNEKIHSFPVLHVVDFLRRAYSAVGVASPTELPALGELEANGFTEIRTVEGGDNEFWSLEADLAGILKQEFSNKQALPPGTPEPRLDFYRAAHFHRFRGGDYDSPPEPPKPDFHEALGLLGGHPYLLRRLGLLIDVEVPFDGQAPSGKVLVAQVLHEPDWDDQSVSTNYLLDVPQRLFTAAPGPGSEISGGMLRLDSGDYDLVQVDVDGAALKAVQTANQLFFLHHGRRRSLDSTEDGSLPALRSSGIGVVRTGRAVNLAERLAAVGKANTDIKANTPPDLWADDLTRGYRVDVEDEGVWRSLCRRRATYRIGRLGGPAGLIEPDEDEGVVTAAVTQDVDKTRNELFLHENLFHWDGWSLAAPRPGEAIKTDGLSDKHEELLGADGKTRNPSQTSLELEVTSEPVAGSLPRLRFGRTYRLRARAVDVAGNSLPLSSNDDAEATPPITYKRYEPVEPPTVVIVSQKPLSGLPGDSATRPVIRTYNSTPAEDTVPSVETAERLLLPPRTAVEVIERYGHLDTPQGVDGSQQTWQLLADKDAAEIPEVIDNPADIPAEVPYLADPFAGAAVLRGLPGTPAGSLHVTSFDTAPEWWQGRPFRIATVEGSGPPIWHAGSRVLTVELPKATVTSVLLSSRIYPSDLDKLAVWEWIDEDAFDEDVRQHLRQLALEGCHWMLTPFRELTLVHAVQQPLAPPVIETLEPKKKLGNTFATLEGTVGVHGASTGKVDLLALWSEPTGHGFETADGSALVFDLPVAEPQATAVPWGGRRHEFGDTKHRRVNYYAVATTRFRDYFETEQSQLSAEELTRPRPEELPPHDNQQHIFTAEVLNSARPLAPSVLYVLPTFGWESDKDERGVLSRRRGGLRIYLEEPWFSSGEGELLGVVVWPGRPDGCAGGTEPEGIGEAVEVPDKMKPYATQWGRDPIWLSGPTQQVPSLENFTRAVAIEAGLTLEERPPVPTPLKRADLVGVAGHQVGYDAERGLFFCDLDLDVGDTYFPFVRLALVRYQPRSVPSAELSRVVVADFAQFAPDRIARVAREPENPMRLGITVSGTGYRANASYNCTSDLEARLERWLGPSDGDLGWVPVSLDPIELENVQALETLALWRGSLELPDHLPGARFRVVIEEYESFLSDVPSLKLSPKDDDTFGSGRDRRLVYSDAVEIDTANSTP